LVQMAADVDTVMLVCSDDGPSQASCNPKVLFAGSTHAVSVRVPPETALNSPWIRPSAMFCVRL